MIIDADSHWLPRDPYQYVDPDRSKQVPLYRFDLGLTAVHGANPVRQNHNPLSVLEHSELQGVWDLDQRWLDMQRQGLDMQVLAPQDLALRFNYSVEPGLARDMTHSYNLHLAQVDRGRWIPLAHMPLQCAESAWHELRWAHSQGIRQVYVDYVLPQSHTPRARLWSARPDLDAWLDLVHSTGTVLYMHQFMHHLPVQPELHTQDLPLTALSQCVADWIRSGRLDRWPGLKLVLAESPGWGSELCKAVQRLRSGPTHRAKHCVDHYLTSNFWVTVDIEATDTVRQLSGIFGTDRLLFSTDYPHSDPSGQNKWQDRQDLALSAFTLDQQCRIGGQNAAELFGLAMTQHKL